MSGRFRIEIGNSMSDYVSLAEEIRAFANEAKLSAAEATHLELVIEELVVNIVKHGYGDGRRGGIAVEIMVGPDLSITLSDDGDPFDPVAAAAPDLDLVTEERPIGGLGIHFVRTLMDTMQYRREAGRNVLVLRKRLDRPRDQTATTASRSG